MDRRNRHSHDEDSSSSSDFSSSSSSRSSSTRRARANLSSSCGIRSVNEYHDRLMNTRSETAQAHVETGDSSKAWAGARATNHNNGHYSSSAHAGVAAISQGNLEVGIAKAIASAEFGPGGAIAEADADATYFSYGDDEAQIDLAKGYVGGGIGAGAAGAKAKLEAGVDLVDCNLKFSENQGMDVNVGLNANTGAEIGVDGVGVSFLGFGVSAGRNTGISTPFGGISFKLW